VSILRIIVIALGIYALYLPVALIVHRHYVEIPRPAGAVEMLLQFYFDSPDQYVARLFKILPDQDVTQFVAYEGSTPLNGIKFAEVVYEKSRHYVVRIRASDGTDPRTNGRHYWLVRIAK
jgi:hypothetical protein